MTDWITKAKEFIRGYPDQGMPAPAEPTGAEPAPSAHSAQEPSLSEDLPDADSVPAREPEA